jgi:RNA-binding motif X-linked protein 2
LYQGSWHQKYLRSAWVYVGNLDHSLTEGDILCVMSQYGEIEDINLVRDETTGKSKGFGFLKYEDARSCVLAVDNLGGADVCGRSLRVDHVENYRLPKHLQEKEEIATEQLTGPGHAYQWKELENEFSLARGQDLFAPLGAASTQQNGSDADDREAKRRRKEERRRQREEKEIKRKEKALRQSDREERRRMKRAKSRGGDSVRKHSKQKRKSRSPSKSPSSS